MTPDRQRQFDMASIVIIGNDQGGAVALAAILNQLASHHEVHVMASGPAYDLWQHNAVKLERMDDATAQAIQSRLQDIQPDLVVTGTSHYSELERSAWIAAKALGIPSLAVVDAWVNFPERFTRLSDNVLVHPDAVATIDDNTSNQVSALLGDKIRCHVTGHPHLEGIVEKHKKRGHHKRANDITKVMFFSNPVYGDEHEEGSYHDQFDAIEFLFNACEASQTPLMLGIKPHPREPMDRWDAWAQEHKDAFDRGWVRFESGYSEPLIEDADIVSGITSMALVEGALMDKALLSIQLSRHIQINPILDNIDGICMATTETDVKEGLERLLNNLTENAPANSFAGLFVNSTGRLLEAIELESAAR